MQWQEATTEGDKRERESIRMAITLERENPTTMESAADLIAATERDGVEFLFAMFVDMHGKPCAKMVPVSAIEGFMADGGRFRRVRRRADGSDPVVARHPRSA